MCFSPSSHLNEVVNLSGLVPYIIYYAPNDILDSCDRVLEKRCHSPPRFMVIHYPVGTLAGGWLSSPCDQHPQYFNEDSTPLFCDEPYLLPCLAGGAVGLKL